MSVLESRQRARLQILVFAEEGYFRITETLSKLTLPPTRTRVDLGRIIYMVIVIEDEVPGVSCGDIAVPRLPGLSAAVISKNVWHEIAKLKSAPSWQEATGRSSETLAKYSGLTVVLLLMKAGTQIRAHRVDGWTSVYVIQGRLKVHVLEEQCADLGVGELLILEPALEHDVQAPEESAFLLTIAGAHGAI
jgi:quercetin dioxygenase-like cupin family protein